jgi:type IV pilus assembly protein PilY1
VEPSDGDQVILVFGERRGGSYYYGLDVTDPNRPLLLWDIHPEPGNDFEEMGQSWCKPVVGTVKIGTEDRQVVFLGGGYDPNQDDDPAVESDSMGRGIYVVDLCDGSLVWKHSHADDPDMAFCIPSDIVALNINDDIRGYVDRLYVGDAGGQMWRCDIGDPNPTNWTARIIFDDAGAGRKIFYPPDVVFEPDCEILFWGTGDRANPKNETIINRIYALKDRDTLSPRTPTNLYNATDNLVQDGTDAQQEAALNDLASLEGWYIELDQHVGEKVLAPSIVYAGAAYLTTFTPTAGSITDPCYVGEGTARLYALDYLTAAAVLNFDTSSEELHKNDRHQRIGTAIPSGVVIALVQGKAAGFIGVGGGIFAADMKNRAAITRLYWRVVP